MIVLVKVTFYLDSYLFKLLLLFYHRLIISSLRSSAHPSSTTEFYLQ